MFVRLWRHGAQWLVSLHAKHGLRGVAICLLGILVALGSLTLVVLWITLPNIDDPETMFASQSTVILDRNGVELYRLFSEQDRTYVKGDDISSHIKQATIAIEDERFLSRSGCFDVIGFTRAVLSQIAPQFFVRSGGSTLTQQFAKNALVGRQRSLLRKVRELMLACSLDSKYSKDELLELYLNWIPYGQNAYGIEQASKSYFNTSAKDVSLAEATILASLPQRPSYFSPYGKHVRTTVTPEIAKAIGDGTITSISAIDERGISIGLIGQTVGTGARMLYIGGRTDQVLQNMVQQSMITEDERTKALADLQSIVFTPARQNIRAPHFVLDVEKQVESLLGISAQDSETVGASILERGGFRITTTLDWSLQQVAEKVVATHKDDAVKRFGAHNIALVALAPRTREVLAYVGNADFGDDEHEGKIDMAKSSRQPGSSFKAFTYLGAFEAGYGPGSIIYDVPTKFGTDEPQNYDGTFWGPITMRRALAGSRNIPAIKVFFLEGGEEKLLSVAEKLGVTAPSISKQERRKSDPNFDYGWPIAIGSAEVPLLEMVQGYASIADGGVYRPMTSILKITDPAGNLRYVAKQTTPVQVADARHTALVTSILSDINARPPNDYWKTILTVPGFSAAAKTGTSNKCLERDTKQNCTLRRPESLWTLGYTPNLIAGVWVGNATSQSLYENADGLTVAAPIWHDFMVSAHRTMKNPVTAFVEPARISHPLLSKLSGKLATECTPSDLRAPDLVLDENVPTEDDPGCAVLTVDKVTGLLASESCPIEASGEQPFFVPKSELPDRWPFWEKGVQDWAVDQMKKWNAVPDHSGSLLPLPVAPTKTCDPSLTPGRFDPLSVTIVSPQRGSSLPYPSFSPLISIDTKAPLKQVAYFVDDKRVRSFDAEPFFGSMRVTRGVERTGTHTLKVVVTDAYFKTAEAETEFVFE